MILGYPWFAATQPKINWARGWIDYTQLPVVIKAPNAHQAIFTSRLAKGRGKEPPNPHIRRTTEQWPPKAMKPIRVAIPQQYCSHTQVFSKRRARRFPQSRIWDHAIDLKTDAPSSLPGKVYSLMQSKQKALQEFVKEHSEKGYICPSKSPYAAPFFFIKKKDGKLRPVQDYRKVNEWTIKNRYPLPLIPELINRVKDATLFSKFDVRWGYNQGVGIRTY
jgi:hypothetical protein